MVYFRKGLKEKDSERRGSGNTWLKGTEEVNLTTELVEMRVNTRAEKVALHEGSLS